MANGICRSRDRSVASHAIVGALASVASRHSRRRGVGGVASFAETGRRGVASRRSRRSRERLGCGVGPSRVEERREELERGGPAGARRVGDVRDDEEEDGVVRRRLVGGVLQQQLAAEEGDARDVDAGAAVVERERQGGGVEGDAHRLDGLVGAESLEGHPADRRLEGGHDERDGVGVLRLAVLRDDAEELDDGGALVGRRALGHLLEADVEHDGVDARDADRQAEELVERLGDDAEEVRRGARREEADDLLPEGDDGVVVVGGRRVAEEEEERVRREEVRAALAWVGRLEELEEVLQEEAPEPQELLADARARRVRLARQQRQDDPPEHPRGRERRGRRRRVEDLLQHAEALIMSSARRYPAICAAVSRSHTAGDVMAVSGSRGFLLPHSPPVWFPA